VIISGKKYEVYQRQVFYCGKVVGADVVVVGRDDFDRFDKTAEGLTEQAVLELVGLKPCPELGTRFSAHVYRSAPMRGFKKGAIRRRHDGKWEAIRA
jgi:hypothetical protein